MGIALTIGSIVVFLVLVFTAPWPEEEEVAQSSTELAEATSQPAASLETSQVVVNALPVATAGCLSARSAEATAEFARKIVAPVSRHFNSPGRTFHTASFRSSDLGLSSLAHLHESCETDNPWLGVATEHRREHRVLAKQGPGRKSMVRIMPSPASVVSVLSVAPSIGRSSV